jgi:uncharacterized protein DUF6812
MTNLTARTAGISGRFSPEHPRELQPVQLVLVDGAQLRGMLHRAWGARTLDFLNQSEGFVAMTDVELIRGSHEVEQIPFMAINKAHIVRVMETPEDEA